MSEKKTETSIPVVIPVDAEKLSQGLRMTFEGMSMVFDSIGAGCRISEEAGEEHEADALSAEAARKTADEKPDESAAKEKKHTETQDPSQNVNAEESVEKAEAIETAQSPEKNEKTETAQSQSTQDTPATKNSAPAKAEDTASAPSVTLDDITRIIVQKIKKDRGNNVKIGSILKTYGAAKVSELPAEKYEAFLTDLAAL